MTLVEVVVAFGILAVAALALIAAFVSGMKLSAHSRDITIASEVAKQVLERTRDELRMFGFDYIPAGTYSFDGRAGDFPIGIPPFPPGPYPTTRISDQDYFVVVTGEEPAPGRLKNVRVDVYWHGDSHVTMETKFSP